MLIRLVVSLALVQTVPIGSALRDGVQLLYESAGVAQTPWVYDSVRVVVREEFDRCVITYRRSQPVREGCVRADTLFERTAPSVYRVVRPIGPNMQLELRSASGDILHYETRDFAIHRIAGAGEFSYLPTVIVTRTPAGSVTRRLREHYAPSLLTAIWGVFETPDDSGGWTTVREFSLLEIRGPNTGQLEIGGNTWTR